MAFFELMHFQFMLNQVIVEHNMANATSLFCFLSISRFDKERKAKNENAQCPNNHANSLFSYLLQIRSKLRHWFVVVIIVYVIISIYSRSQICLHEKRISANRHQIRLVSNIRSFVQRKNTDLRGNRPQQCATAIVHSDRLQPSTTEF